MSTVEDLNLTKLRHWREDNGSGPDEWPAPPEFTEYRVEGKMRADILARLGRPADDPCVIRLISGEVEGGYSEWTVEWEYPIEVWVDHDGHTQRVFDKDFSWSEDDSIASLLQWIEGK